VHAPTKKVKGIQKVWSFYNESLEKGKVHKNIYLEGSIQTTKKS